MSFNALGLSEGLLEAVAKEGYTEPTPIQAKAIPEILAGRDLLAAAQTGTGKTAAFTLPLLHKLHASQEARPASETRRHVRVLVLTPTRELAAQVADSVRTYGRNLPSVRTAVIFGGVGINPQIDMLRRGVDIVVATPGRLLDHVQQRTADLSKVEVLVLDEADRMLDMGFIHDIKRVIKLLPAQRQNLLFSATFSGDIRSLAEGLLKNPVSIDIAPRNSAAESVNQRVIHCPKGDKAGLLGYMISRGNWKQTLVFTRTKHGANRLAERLEKDGITTAALHGNKSQNARTKALAALKAGEVRVLVATDIAARGLDIEQLPHVVNYELPNVPEDYVHRIGRTGRAGAVGEAISLVEPEERGYLKDIEKLLRKPIPTFEVEGYTPGPRHAEEPRPPRPPQQGRRGGGQGRGGHGGGQHRHGGASRPQHAGGGHHARHDDDNRGNARSAHGDAPARPDVDGNRAGIDTHEHRPQSHGHHRGGEGRRHGGGGGQWQGRGRPGGGNSHGGGRRGGGGGGNRNSGR